MSAAGTPTIVSREVMLCFVMGIVEREDEARREIQIPDF